MILGVDIGGTELKAGIVSRQGVLTASTRTRTPPSLAEFGQAMQHLLANLPLEGVSAIGIGCKGIVDSESTRVLALPGTMNYLEGSVLTEFLPTGLPALADNDARAALAGEVAWGAACGRRHAIMLTLGTGVGGGILADGQILRGATGVAGHLGHYVVNPAGPRCMCGNYGCLETYFSARAIESEAAAAIHRGATHRWQSNPTCAQVFEAAAEGEDAARWIIDRATRYLEGAISGLLLAVDPEIVILGGQITGAGDSLIKPLEAAVDRRTRVMLRRTVPIVRTQLADGTGVIGAAALVAGISPRQTAAKT